jgi:hypothetical protein
LEDLAAIFLAAALSSHQATRIFRRPKPRHEGSGHGLLFDLEIESIFERLASEPSPDGDLVGKRMMGACEEDELVAATDLVGVYFDTSARKPVALPQSVYDRAKDLVDHGTPAPSAPTQT